MWDVEKHTKIENKAYLEGRAGEWSNLPIYATEMIVPPLFYFVKWYYVIPVVFLLNIIWGFFSTKVINLRLSHIIYSINKFRWIVFIVFGFFYISKSMYVEAALSFLWPFITILLAFLNLKNNYQEIKQIFEKILYNKEQ